MSCPRLILLVMTAAIVAVTLTQIQMIVATRLQLTLAIIIILYTIRYLNFCYSLVTLGLDIDHHHDSYNNYASPMYIQ